MPTASCVNTVLDLIINLFLEWSVCRRWLVIQTEQITEGLIDGDKSIFYFFESREKVFS